MSTQLEDYYNPQAAAGSFLKLSCKGLQLNYDYLAKQLYIGELRDNNLQVHQIWRSIHESQAQECAQGKFSLKESATKWFHACFQ